MLVSLAEASIMGPRNLGKQGDDNLLYIAECYWNSNVGQPFVKSQMLIKNDFGQNLDSIFA